MFLVRNHVILIFWSFSVFFHLVQQYVSLMYSFLIQHCYLSGFICFIEREIQNSILKLGKFFHGEKLQCSGPRNEIWWKAIFLSNLCKFLGKIVHVVIDMYFSLFLKGLKIFVNPRLSLIVPLSYLCTCKKWKTNSGNQQNYQHCFNFVCIYIQF